MKFSKGLWQMLEDVAPMYPARVHDTEKEGGAFLIHAVDHASRERWALIGGTMLTLRVSSPLPDVLRLTVTHFAGGRRLGPDFAFEPQQPATIDVDENELVSRVSSGRLALEIQRQGTWRFQFLGDGKPITTSGPRALGLMQRAGRTYLREQLSLGVGELVYGLGERFTAVVRNGQGVDMWNEDPGTASDLAYKNVPFYLTNRGYGVLVNHPGRVSFELATERVNAAQFSVEGEELDYYLFYGPSVKEVLEKYTALVGRPRLPPAWSFGLWLTTSFTTDYDEKTVSSYIDGMAERDLPLSVFHFDCFWMREHQWCNFEWDERMFPDPKAMLERLKARGLKICVWINPYIGQRSPMFREGMERGYLLRRPNGDVFQIDDWQPGLALVDFTNEEATRWYQDKLLALLRMGVDCFKTDFGERIPTDVVYRDGSDPVRMHNYYAYLYNRAVFEVLETERGVGEATVFARSATVGCQKFPVHWGGDCSATFESMAETLRGGLSIGLSGFSFWSHDIGGFEQTATPALYKRWVAFGLLSSHSRLHGSGSPRVPWNFDQESVDVLRLFTRLKCRLMPYLFAAAREASQTGVPVLRHMMLEFPEDPACSYLERQYMLGSALLVAPVFNEEGFVEYYLPDGSWRHLLSGRIERGGRWIRERLGFLEMPIYQRPNTVLPFGAVADRPDYDYGRGVELRVHALEDGEHQVAVLGLDANVSRAFRVVQKDVSLSVHAHQGRGPWMVRVADAMVDVIGGKVVETGATGSLIAPDGDELQVRLSRST